MVRAHEVEEAGIPHEYLRQLCGEGELQRVGPTDAPMGAGHSLALVARRLPAGVVCLLSALRLHDLTTQNPYEVWLAVGIKAHRPRLEYPALRIVRFGPLAQEMGVEYYKVDGVRVRATNPARTVVDCFRYRNKVGIDVALEALRDYLKPEPRLGGSVMENATPEPMDRDALWRLAIAFRMTRVLRPYLEALS